MKYKKLKKYKINSVILSIIINFSTIFIFRSNENAYYNGYSYGLPYELVSINIRPGSYLEDKYIWEALAGDYLNISINIWNFFWNILFIYILLIALYNIIFLIKRNNS